MSPVARRQGWQTRFLYARQVHDCTKAFGTGKGNARQGSESLGYPMTRDARRGTWFSFSRKMPEPSGLSRRSRAPPILPLGAWSRHSITWKRGALISQISPEWHVGQSIGVRVLGPRGAQPRLLARRRRSSKGLGRPRRRLQRDHMAATPHYRNHITLQSK
jgi:hypothetical protein